MYNKFRFIILLFLSFLAFNVNGQNEMSITSDTIYIYETEIVYDTIFVIDTIDLRATKPLELLDFIERNPFAISALLIDTAKRNANLLLVSKNYSATIPINNIILNEHNKNLESMKKLNFLGVILFATQSMLFAQSDFGISVGGGMWWAKANSNLNTLLNPSYFYKPIESSKLSAIYSAGLYWEKPVIKRFVFLAEINYNYLSNAAYENQIATRIYNATTPPSAWTTVFYEQVGCEMNYHQFSIPLQIGYRLGKITPLAGVEYSYKISSNMRNANNRFSALVGVKYKFSDKISLKLSYNHGLTYDYKVNGNIYHYSSTDRYDVGKYNVYWKSNSIGLTLYYSLKKRKTEDENVI